MPILLVEDNAPLREATQLLLEAHGYEVVAVERAADALALLRDGPLPGLILLDLLMPDMDGFQFRERLMEDPRLARIPVVIWSGHSLGPADAERLHGATIIPKPVDADVVVRTIGALLQPER